MSRFRQICMRILFCTSILGVSAESAEACMRPPTPTSPIRRVIRVAFSPATHITRQLTRHINLRDVVTHDLDPLAAGLCGLFYGLLASGVVAKSCKAEKEETLLSEGDLQHDDSTQVF
jgi:hypothetical protein